MIKKNTNVKKMVEGVDSQVIKWRHHLHENPELSFQEIKTSQYVYEILQSFGGLEISRPTKTSVMARLIGAKQGNVLALRADMDALPIQEETDLPFVSKNDGVMHACGNDGHTAMLLGAAKVLSQMKDKIQGEIRFLFQHAEELHPGGAQEMVKAGVMENVDAVTGIHLASQAPVGHFSFTYGAATAANDTFDIVIKGEGGHASQPHSSIDPVAIAAQLVNGINQFVSRKVDPTHSVVISVTNIHGGTAHNVIPDTTRIGGSVRTFNPEIRKLIPKWIEQYTKALTEANECSYEMDYINGYSTVVNEEEISSLAAQTIVETFGENCCLVRESPAMGSEDFSAFSNIAPGCLVWLGAGSENFEDNFPHHHPLFTIKDDALKIGVMYHVQLALNYINRS